MRKTSKKGESARLVSQSNWLSYISKKGSPEPECYGGSEYPFYSDVQVLGEIQDNLGPYALLNALPFGNGNSAEIAVIFRAFHYEAPTLIQNASLPFKTVDDSYHGGWLAEELAALTSLALGVRMKSGDAIRRFDGRDPLGTYQSAWLRSTPSLSFRKGKPMVPMPRHASLNDIQGRLKTIPTLDADLFKELIRAARSYQDALWLAESEPHLSWLILVSALEISANAHITIRGTPSENLEEFKPELADLVRNSGGDFLLDAVSEQLKSLFSATKKFLEFCKEFAPPPPAVRPEMAYHRIDWTWPELKKTLNKVYELRSRALHAGYPFPAPMCTPPEWYENDAPSEKAITALAVQTQGAQWVPNDAPITLNTFAYFVRGALLNWWDHLAKSAEQNNSPQIGAERT